MSVVDFIDGKNFIVVDKKECVEFVKRKLEVKEWENEIIVCLGKIGGGVGREYMKVVIFC